MGGIKKNKWFVEIKKRREDLFDTSGMRAIEPPEGTYWADPFLFGKYLFFEDYDYDKGVISYIELNADGAPITKPKKVLEKDYHLSFPFLIEDKGEIYMIPETGANQTIELYRAVEFPEKWEFVKNIIEGISAGDTVVYKNGSEFVLFTTESGDNNLRIMVANDLLGEWNTVFREQILYSRSAGNIFEREGKIIRPVQNCQEIYGGAVVFKEIQFAPYREKVVRHLVPREPFTGLHTFNFNEDFVVIDKKIPL